MNLYYEGTDIPVNEGDEVVTRKGEVWYVVGWREPQHAGSTGRVHVQDAHQDGVREFFPSVFGMTFKAGG